MNFTHPGLIFATSKKPENMSFVHGDVENSLENRRRFLNRLGINYLDLVCGHQVHGNTVRCIIESDKGKGALSADSSINDTDAFITNIRNLPLGVFTADCLPVCLFDPVHQTLGLAHAGWRSTKGMIIINVVGLMREKFNSHAHNLCAVFGPCIRSCCYEVKQEFREYFPWAIEQREGGFYFDLAGVNKKQLLEAGLKKENIFDNSECTYCRQEEYFSYRREPDKCGRMLSVAMLK
ncbi:MAG: peptidoglycan editing factor PgeF [Candidatus Omnitrophota bacterium]